MDNRLVDVTSEDMDDLKALVKILFKNAPGGKVSHYAIKNIVEKTNYHQYGTNVSHTTQTIEDQNGKPTLIFYWDKNSNETPLPYPMEEEDCFNFIKGWLKNVEKESEPDHDGDNHNGWRVFNENWGAVLNNNYAVLAVQFEWAMYGK